MKKVFCVLIGLLILALPASALVLSFDDSSYVGNNEIVITDHNREKIARFSENESSEITLPQGKAYFVKYQPAGFFDFADETPNTWPSGAKTLDFIDHNLAAIFALIAVICIAFIFSRRSS